MKLIGSIKNKIIKNENGENVPDLEITEVLLLRYNVVNNDYQHKLRVWYVFVLNELFGQLLNVSSKKLIFSNNSISEFIQSIY